jgi:cell division protein FtsA
MRRIIASLDIGSSTIKLVVGEIVKNRVNILACVDTPSRGVKNGFIVNSESTIEALTETFSKIEEELGLKVSKVIVTVPTLGLECFMSEADISIHNENNVVCHADLVKCIEKTVGNKVSPNMEVVSIMPTHFIINDTDKVENPLGMMAEKLTVRTVIAVVPKKNITPIVGCLERIGVKVVDTIIGPLGDFYQFKTKEMLEQVGAIINIGASNTTVSILNKGILTSSEMLDTGGNIVDNDIGYVYKISRGDAIYLKENLALAHKSLAQPNESLTVNNKNGDPVKINQYDLSEICMQRLEEILNLTKKQINLLTKKEISYIIVTGGLTEFVDFSSILDEVFNHKAKIGEVNEIGVRDNKYSTSVGVIKYYNSRLKLKNVDFSIFSIDEQEELSGLHRKVSLSDNSILGKLFGYFFDN